MSTNVNDRSGTELGETTARPPSVIPTALVPRRVMEPIARRPERRLAGDPREAPATVAALRAKVRAALMHADTEAEAFASSRLARHLLALDAHLDEAVTAGRRAIALRPDDEELRRLVSNALRSLGEPGLAAAILRPVVDAACARASRDADAAEGAVEGLLALGDLLLRAGDVDGAVESFRYVAVVAPERPDGQERLAIARGIAPQAIAPELAARAYIGAAKKHQLAGDDARSLEALARAFETDPTSPLAATVLADALEDVNRLDAADAIRAEHAHALGAKVEAAAVIHATRREKARLRGDRPTVVATVLDEVVDVVHATEPGTPHRDSPRIDATLEEIPILAFARRRLRALLATEPESLGAWRAVASSRDTTAEQRLEAFAEIVSRDPADEQALAAMREQARLARDPAPIVEALTRALKHERPPTEQATIVFGARAAELAGWADEQLDDPGLAAWAWERVLFVVPDPGDAMARRARDELARLATRRAQAEERLAASEHLLTASRAPSDETVRDDALRARIRALVGRPDREDALVDAIRALLGAHPGDATAIAAIDRVVRRVAPEHARTLLDLRDGAGRLEAALRRGDLAHALELASQGGTDPATIAMRIALALRVGSSVDLGRALSTFATVARERGAILAASARACRIGGEPAEAFRYATEGVREGPREYRPAIELAELAALHPGIVDDDTAGAALERALAGVGPRGRWALTLATIAEASVEPALAAAWTRRAWSLRPGDIGVARRWLARAVALADPEIISEVVSTTSSQVASLSPIATELAAALRALFADDARNGEAVARELLSIGAVRVAPLRDAILEAKTAPPSLAIAVEERWLASGASAADRPRVLLSVAERARTAGDASRAADAAARALAEPEVDDETRARAQALIEAVAVGPLDPDAELAVRRALGDLAADQASAALDRAPRARLAPEDDARVRASADAWRALGRDLWDLAGDRDAALRAWLAGARYLGGEGLDRLEADIAHFGGDEAVRDALFELARREDVVDEEAKTRSAVSPFARIARVEAFRLRAWQRLLEQPPTWVEPLSLAREAAARAADPAALLPGLEQLAQRQQRIDMLGELYDIAAGRTAGRYGARGVHYRAARFLDRLGHTDEALTHAARAFSSVPSEGALMMMVERLARHSTRPEIAIQALTEAADQADDEDRKAIWLDRAAIIAERGRIAPEERVELLLRLFLTAPTVRTAEALVSALRAAIELDPATKDTTLTRIVRAHKKVEARIAWSQRVPILVVLAPVIGELDSVDGALSLVARDAAATPRGDLGPLRAVVEELAQRDPEAARTWLDRESTGGVLRAHAAAGAGDPDRAIDLLVEHAPPADELDFGDPTPGASGGAVDSEVEHLERWAPHARDKRVIAKAWERFGRRHGAAAELETARALDEAGQTQDAARALVDAWNAREGAPIEVVMGILALARQILPQAGADAALVDILIEDLQANEGGESADRIARWREIGEIRATRLGDRHAALDALVEAGRIAPGDDELWNEIGDLAEALGAHERLAAALAQRLQRARPEKRVTLLRKLARVLEHDLARDTEAAERWAELVRLLPLDAEAADALERIAERRGDGAQLLDLLRARASRLPVGHAERTRALRRIARELGGVQGRRGEVLSALREVHLQNPGDLEIATQLATIARGTGDLGTASEALTRAFRASTRDAARVHLAIEAARLLLELHDHETASRILGEAAAAPGLESDPRALDLVRLQLEVAIARSDSREEAIARMRLADLDIHAPPERRAANYSAASRALLSLGDRPHAKDLAWRAARLAPGDAAISGALVELEFAVVSAEGANAPRVDRRRASAEDGELLGLLMRVDQRAPAIAETLSIIAFARAELLDAARGPGAGYQDLNAWPEEVRNRPLVQLALAERLAAEWSFGQAAAAYERAFAGDLHGLRALGPTALQAADAAGRSNDASRAKSFLDVAARDPACRIDARRRAVELARAVGDLDGALRALERLAAEATGQVRAQALAEQARLLTARDPEAAVEVMKLAVLAAEEGSTFRDDLERERVALDGARGSRSLPPAPPPSLRDSGITAKGSSGSYDRAMAMMLGAPAESSASAPAAWIAPQSDSEPPPEAPPKSEAETKVAPPVKAQQAAVAAALRALEGGIREESAPRVRDPRRDPSEPVVETVRARTPAPFPAVVIEDMTSDSLSDQPRLTLAELPPMIATSTPALPRPAAESRALDLESLDRVAQDTSAPIADRVRALKTLGEASHEAGRADEATRHFISALELGDVSAGDQAAELLALLPGRTNDLLLVRRRQVFLAPGDARFLDSLHEAAMAARDLVFARAIDHVRRAFDPVAGPVPPPAIEAQLDRPDLLLPLLERRAHPIAAEALRLTWDNAQLLFRREPAILRGMDRVTGTIPLGKVVAAATRLLGAARTTVYLRPRGGRDVDVQLLSPPVVVLGSDCKEDNADTRYALGVGILAAQAAHCLLLGQSADAAHATWQALLSAFGPPEHGRGIAPDVGRLAAALWQSIPRGAQRRLGELLGQAPPAFDVALEGARQVARRGGLYLSGDLAAAVRAALVEAGEPFPTGKMELGALCAHNTKVADLFRLATSPEYAEARWRLPGGTGARRSPSTSGFVPPSQR